MPRFSIVMPVYNKRPYLRKAVESILSQTCEDWELILIDNGSTDGSGELATTFKDHRINHLYQEHSGVSTARNVGVEHASAPWLCFLDADDWWEPTFLEEMAGLIERHPEAGLYTTGYFIFKHGQKKVAPTGLDDTFHEGEIDYFTLYAGTLCMPLCIGTVCLPTKLFIELQGFNANLHLGEDFDLWVRIVSTHKVVALNKPLFTYNQDVSPKYRSTRQLHSPEHHFLWHLATTTPDGKLKQLLDRMTAYSLLPYYLSRRYHDATLPLLKGIDWNNLPSQLHQPYLRPLWLERSKYLVTNALVRLRGLVK